MSSFEEIGWVYERGHLNHDWLRNEFLRQLQGFIERLHTPDNFRDKLLYFRRSVLPIWPMKGVAILDLINRFEKEMSPRQVFTEWPLLVDNNPEARKRLGELAHAWWHIKCPVRCWVDEALAAHAEADAAYVQLTEKLAVVAEDDVTGLAALQEDFESFAVACATLSERLSAFPHELPL